jgi:hypothetical protein
MRRPPIIVLIFSMIDLFNITQKLGIVKAIFKYAKKNSQNGM